MGDLIDLTPREYFRYFDAIHDVTLIPIEGFQSVAVTPRGNFVKTPSMHMPKTLYFLIQAVQCLWDPERFEFNQRETNTKFFCIVDKVHYINLMHKKIRRFVKHQLSGRGEYSEDENSLYTLRAMRFYSSYSDFFQKWNEQIEAYVEAKRSTLLQFQHTLMCFCGLFPSVTEAELMQELIVDGIGFYKKHEKIALPRLNKPLCEMFAVMCKRIRESTHGIINEENLKNPLSSLKILGGIFPNEAAARYASDKMGVTDPNIRDLIKNNALMSYLNPYLDRSAIEDYLETLRVLISAHGTGLPVVEGHLVEFSADIAPVLDIILKTVHSIDDLFELLAAIRHHLPYFETELLDWILTHLIDKLRHYCSSHPQLETFLILVWIRNGIDFLEDFPDAQNVFKAQALLFLKDLTLNNPTLLSVSKNFALEFFLGPHTPKEDIELLLSH